MKSIFGSPKVFQLYRKLKERHLFVYPEIPICVFVEKEHVKHLFVEKLHEGYFLTCRVDFLVCDNTGKSELAVEYHGGYHEADEQKTKDAFKEKLLGEVGLPLRSLTDSELQDL